MEGCKWIQVQPLTAGRIVANKPWEEHGNNLLRKRTAESYEDVMSFQIIMLGRRLSYICSPFYVGQSETGTVCLHKSACRVLN